MTDIADDVIVLDHADERSVVRTRFASTALARLVTVLLGGGPGAAPL